MEHTMRNALGEAVRAAHTQIPADIRCAADYERHAIHHIEAQAWQHIQSGADQNLTLSHNRAALDALRLVPQPVADLRHAHTRIELLGQTLASPLLLAPVAYQRLVHPEGELATVRAAMALQTGMVVSTLSSFTLEEIAQAGQAAATEMGHSTPRWFQLYMQPAREHSLQLIRRAEAAGYTAIVWTVDASIKRSGFALPHGVEAANLRGMPSTQHTPPLLGPILFGTPLMQQIPTWDDLRWLRAQTQLPIIVKGILSPAQAQQAVDLGADALIVSNHGGRVLDGVVSPIEVLPAIAQAVQGQVPLLLDSGVRHGTDVVKALALGASAALIGRPQLYALATAGLVGVAHLLHLLRAELELTMAQLGCATVADITPAVLWQQR
ncbi:alpha-hydroxy-acid oxidizing enzyme [Comamonas kerstersii]|uniref:2-hydroxy-acid oxidase n=2 Tax=Comamonas kerstersii TaxID=225992 RepID=A0A0W7YZG0_9BURK|nr:2-hydroxy-acid oxidase [Comamonas kerstersii]OOH86981.1 alpha-hydroxy-acid oxidizing enzyme [Comamonas kerstersii]OOH90004.1 alpha-hydroxy-acid oxidizing enzyme [Comamonas kerstersii]